MNGIAPGAVLWPDDYSEEQQAAYLEKTPLRRSGTPEDAAARMGDAVWPVITEDYKKLKARPGVIAAGVAAVGLGYAVHRLRNRD